MSSSKSEFDKILAQHVHAASLISDEEEAEAVWKEILARKGLPLDTPYKYIDNKAYDESYCDRLFATIREKKKNPEAAKSWGDSAFEWLPAPASPRKTISSDFRLTFDERNSEKKKKKSINRLIYQDEDSENKRKAYLLKKRDESIEWFKQREAKFGPAANHFLRH
ncbi:hypothetical protein CTI12_AA470470 [Artemisia annua]|uniref:Uncharacterized protein n=1 Tax=Artemisia annua TaxID=35608 RepID=A0A2U1LNY6_ARTAN|nr:hypothetical protein CTI12_AA470470 [Artemisia annua]